MNFLKRCIFVAVVLLGFHGTALALSPELEIDRQVLMAEEDEDQTVQVSVIGEPGHYFLVGWSRSNKGYRFKNVDLSLGPDVRVAGAGWLDAEGYGSFSFIPVAAETIYLQGITSPDSSLSTFTATTGKALVSLNDLIKKQKAPGGIFTGTHHFVYGTGGTYVLHQDLRGQNVGQGYYQSALPISCTAGNFGVALTRPLTGTESMKATLVNGTTDVLSCTISEGQSGCTSEATFAVVAHTTWLIVRIDMANLDESGNSRFSWGFTCN